MIPTEIRLRQVPNRTTQRIAILSDIHGNGTAFDAVLADLRQISPDLVLHGGDLADGCTSGPEIVDRLRHLGWQGVVGNADEMLFRPESLTQFAAQVPQMQALFAAVAEIGEYARGQLGAERLAWLADLPQVQLLDSIALVHASPASCWRSPAHTASDEELRSVFGPLGKPIVVYGHIHRPFVRTMDGLTVINTGSVGLPFDGDQRASYLLIDGTGPAIRRVDYDVNREIVRLKDSKIPHADWAVRNLMNASPQAFAPG